MITPSITTDWIHEKAEVILDKYDEGTSAEMVDAWESETSLPSFYNENTRNELVAVVENDRNWG